MNIKRKDFSNDPRWKTTRKKARCLRSERQGVSTLVTITVRKLCQAADLDNELSTPFASLITPAGCLHLSTLKFSHITSSTIKHDNFVV